MATGAGPFRRSFKRGQPPHGGKITACRDLPRETLAPSLRLQQELYLKFGRRHRSAEIVALPFFATHCCKELCRCIVLDAFGNDR